MFQNGTSRLIIKWLSRTPLGKIFLGVGPWSSRTLAQPRRRTPNENGKPSLKNSFSFSVAYLSMSSCEANLKWLIIFLSLLLKGTAQFLRSFFAWHDLQFLLVSVSFTFPQTSHLFLGNFLSFILLHYPYFKAFLTVVVLAVAGGDVNVVYPRNGWGVARRDRKSVV